MATKAIARRRRTVYVRRAVRRASKMTVPVAVIAGFMPLANQVILGYKEGGLSRVSDRVVSSLTGYDPAVQRWEFAYLKNGALPILGGILVHKIASRLGVNRALGRAGVPFLRI